MQHLAGLRINSAPCHVSAAGLYSQIAPAKMCQRQIEWSAYFSQQRCIWDACSALSFSALLGSAPAGIGGADVADRFAWLHG